MYQILRVYTLGSIEARIARIDSGYTVGTWDLDAEEYYPPIHVFPSYEKAVEYFGKYIKPKPITYLV